MLYLISTNDDKFWSVYKCAEYLAYSNNNNTTTNNNGLYLGMAALSVLKHCSP